jgi:hypothetical protein
MVEISMVGSVVFEDITLSMLPVYENKVTVNGCKFCTLRRVVILKPHNVGMLSLLGKIYFMMLHLTAFKM